MKFERRNSAFDEGLVLDKNVEPAKQDKRKNPKKINMVLVERRRNQGPMSKLEPA